MRLILGIILLLLGLGGVLGEVLGIKIPSASWFFDTSRRLPFLHYQEVAWYGWITAIGAVCVGAWFVYTGKGRRQKHPSEILRRRRFMEVKRGVWSLRIILFLVFIASLDFLIVGDKPLMLSYNEKSYYPAFERKVYTGKDFGIEGELADAPVNYRSLKASFADSGNWLVMPLIPYAPTGDSLPPLTEELEMKEGLYYEGGKPYSGLAARVYPVERGAEEVSLHLRFRLREGLLSGPVDGWSQSGERVYSANYFKKNGGSNLGAEVYFSELDKEKFQNLSPKAMQLVHYHPAPPTIHHVLGTDSKGNDVLAYLYGGLQVNIQAALFYIPFVYIIGVSIGLLMGYFGGFFDLGFQRVIEALEAIPFLFVIIIVSSIIPTEMKGLGMILLILIVFGWMGITYLMRTVAYREKARDYVSSARVLGASNFRIIHKHILPNTLSVIVTLVPFAVSGVVTAITSLDYLGFGLPPRYASWGKLLNDGLSNLSAPWLASSAFVVLVCLLTLVTFVGEAVREAWDPKKFTIYK